MHRGLVAVQVAGSTLPKTYCSPLNDAIKWSLGTSRAEMNDADGVMDAMYSAYVTPQVPHALSRAFYTLLKGVQ